MASHITGGKSTGIRAIPAAAKPVGEPKRYLSAFVRFRNEARYLAEFLCFHHALGVEFFYLYNNNSTDEYMTVLKPFIDAGIVSVTDWPTVPVSPSSDVDCVQKCRGETKWLACIDVDEFVFPIAGNSLADFLKDYENFPALTVSWQMFGSSGHIDRPKGMVIESYTKCEAKLNRHVKSIIQPAAVESYGNSHYWIYKGWRWAVDENRRRVVGSFSAQPSASKIRLNHYVMKSQEDYLAKCNANWFCEKKETGEHRQEAKLAQAMANYSDTEEAAIQRFAAATRAVADRLGVKLY